MSPRNLLNIGILIAVIVLAVIAIYPGRQHGRQTTTEHLLPIKKTEVQSISILRPNHPTLQFSKQDQKWMMTSPINARASEHRLMTLLGIIDQPGHSRFPADSNTLAKYGLDAPQYTLKFNDVSLAIGDTDPIHERRYVMFGDTIFLIDDYFSHLLAEGEGAFVDHALLPSGSVITRLQLPDFEVRKADAQWQLIRTGSGGQAEPESYSQDALQTLIDEWRYGRALDISLLPGAYKNSGGAPQIKVYLQERPEPMVFSVEKSAQTIYLIPTDLNIRYHLTKNAAQRLMQLPEPPGVE